MKGLFVKDLKLMMLQKNFLLLILAIVIGMMIFTDDVIFPLGFLSFIVSLFTVSTISYCVFRLNGTASPRQRKGCPLQTGSLLLVNSGYACSFHSVQGGTPYE